MEPDTVEPSPAEAPGTTTPHRDSAPGRPSRTAVVAVATTVLLAVGSSALALSGLRTAPSTTGLAYGSTGTAPAPEAAPQADDGLFLSPGPYGDEPAAVRALPRAPQPLPAPAPAPAAGGTGSAGGPSSGALPISSTAGSGGGSLGLPALPQLLSVPASDPAPPGLALGTPGRGASAENGPLLGLPPGLLSRSDDERPADDDGRGRRDTDLLDEEELTGGQDRPGDGPDGSDPSGPGTERPQNGDRDPSTEPSEPSQPSQPAAPSDPAAPSGDPATMEQMREQAMAMARERFARELEQRRAAAEQEQREREAREAEQRRAAEQQRCDLQDPRPSIEVERDDQGRVTAVRASGFGAGCIDREARLKLTTEEGTVTGTSTVSDGRSARFSLSRPVAPEKITGSSLSTG